MGRKIEVITEDNKSEPQEAVTVYRKMISSDKVDIFLSGCVSAGNFAARAADGPRANPDGAVLDPAAEPGSREMGVQHPAAGRLWRSRRGSNISRRRRRSKRSACCTIRRPMPTCRRTSAEKTAAQLRPRDRRRRAIQAGRRRSERADQQDARGRRRRDPQDRPRRHHADRGQEHQAARPRHADADQRRGSRGVPPGGGGARRQVLLRRLALAGL